MEFIKKYYPVTLAKYAYYYNLTDKEIWKWAKRYSKNVKKLKCMVRNLKSRKRSLHSIKYRSGVRVPGNIAEGQTQREHVVARYYRKRDQTTTRRLQKHFY